MAKVLLDLARHPKELQAVLKVKLDWRRQDAAVLEADESETYKRCYYFLNLTSRSFARVIRALDEPLRHVICIFYLVLRGLDTIEDDMTLPLERKATLLTEFSQRIYQRNWTCDEISLNEKDRPLLIEFDAIIAEFLKLDEGFQRVIADVTDRMAQGMLRYRQKNVRVITLPDYNLYTHYVAGLVGYGLTQLFIASGKEPKLAALDLKRANRLSNSMGLFLQKVNIIKDVYEDMEEGRWFWPKEVWGQYAMPLLSAQLEDAAQRTDSKHFDSCDIPKEAIKLYPATVDTDRDEVYIPDEPSLRKLEACVPDAALKLLLQNPLYAKRCVHKLSLDALALLPDCLEYLCLLENESVRQFCAIPQLMALATFDHFFENQKLFSNRGLKIRKGTTAWIFTHSYSFQSVLSVYRYYLEQLSQKNDKLYVQIGSSNLDKTVKTDAMETQFKMLVSLGRLRQLVQSMTVVEPAVRHTTLLFYVSIALLLLLLILSYVPMVA